MTTLALFGAAGKMGSRISRRLIDAPQYTTLYVEAGKAAQDEVARPRPGTGQPHGGRPPSRTPSSWRCPTSCWGKSRTRSCP